MSLKLHIVLEYILIDPQTIVPAYLDLTCSMIDCWDEFESRSPEPPIAVVASLENNNNQAVMIATQPQKIISQGSKAAVANVCIKLTTNGPWTACDRAQSPKDLETFWGKFMFAEGIVKEISYSIGEIHFSINM